MDKTKKRRKEARRCQTNLKEPTAEENYRQRKTPAEGKTENNKGKQEEKEKQTMQILKDISKEEKGETPRIGNKKEEKQQNKPQENTLLGKSRTG